MGSSNQVIATCVGDCPDKEYFDRLVLIDWLQGVAGDVILAVAVVAIAIIVLYALIKRGRSHDKSS